MATLKIAQRKERIELPPVEFKTLEIEKGEIVLLKPAKGREGIVAFTLGIFENVGNRGSGHLPYMNLARSYRLKNCVELGGLNLPLMDYGLCCYNLNSGLEITVGKEEIVKRLREEERFASHADWISKLNKPYLRD